MSLCPLFLSLFFSLISCPYNVVSFLNILAFFDSYFQLQLLFFFWFLISFRGLDDTLLVLLNSQYSIHMAHDK